MEYSYRVRNSAGQIYKGVVKGEEKGLVIESLLKQNLYILDIQEIETKKDVDLYLRFAKVPSQELVIMTRQLAIMLNSGLPILRTLNILVEQTSNKKLKKALVQVGEDIEAGSSFWQALAKHPDIFSKVYISMIKAGELGGVLDLVLEKLASYLEREREINAKVKTASTYPAFISIFAVIVVFVIISFVMPTFIGMFAAAGTELPIPTQILLVTGLFFKQKWMFILLGILVLFFGLKKWGASETGRYYLDAFYLKFPIIGKALSKIIVARFARTMGILIKSGIPVVQALEVVEEVVGNAVVARAISEARLSINEGDSITKPLKDTGIFEPMVYQMIAVGEETGELDVMLVKMSDYFEEEVMYTIDSLMSLIEPLLILIVAVIVGGIVVATLLPMFEIIGTVGAGF
ncbi:MAG TPA: type II secretion system F family protein [Syntrophomonadaceae bacterium]|nr:type II secretion system F family protein [Syntrophomonadaceae bacterium]